MSSFLKNFITEHVLTISTAVGWFGIAFWGTPLYYKLSVYFTICYYVQARTCHFSTVGGLNQHWVVTWLAGSNCQFWFTLLGIELKTGLNFGTRIKTVFQSTSSSGTRT
jgi:hypothetical protein